jgi:hypothetical protein
MTVKELEHQILSLTFAEKAQILQFLLRDFTAVWTGSTRSPNRIISDAEQNGSSGQDVKQELAVDEFELLADEFSSILNPSSPSLSAHAISRAGIYEEHA